MLRRLRLVSAYRRLRLHQKIFSLIVRRGLAVRQRTPILPPPMKPMPPDAENYLEFCSLSLSGCRPLSRFFSVSLPCLRLVATYGGRKHTDRKASLFATPTTADAVCLRVVLIAPQPRDALTFAFDGPQTVRQLGTDRPVYSPVTKKTESIRRRVM